MIYKLRGEFGEPFFEGSENDVDMIRDAMIKYGVVERKLHIVYPDLHDFILPDSVRDKMYDDVVEYYYQGNDYSGYARDTAVDEVDCMHDYDLYQAYQECYDEYSEEDLPKEYIVARDLEASFKLEQALAEEE